MKGKHSKSRFPLHPSNLSPRGAGALAGLAAFAVIGGIAQTSVSPFDSDSADSAAAVASVPGGKHDRGSAPDGSGTAHAEKAEKKSESRDGSGSDGGSASETDRRSKVIERAKTWNPHSSDRVSYSQVRSHEGYRADCSGYVSMALGLSKPGENTVGLTSSKYTKRIKMSELKKGDLVMDAEGTNNTRHVVIFEKWANDDHTSYWAFEQRGHYGTDYRTRDYGLSSGSEFKAYRPTNL